MKELNHFILPEYRLQGIHLREADDHILELYKNGQLIATFSQTGVTLGQIRKAIADYDRRN